jgi:O-antigen ligase
MNRFFLYLILATSPLPFASARPAWQWLWVVVVGLAAVWYSIGGARKALKESLAPLKLPLALLFLFVGWGFLQSAGLNWGLASTDIEAVNSLLLANGAISINQSVTVSNAVFFLSHIVFFVLVYLASNRRQYSVEILRFCGACVAVYATYGFIVYVSGNDTILWFEKWTNYSSLTSTFVNRNSFAAFAGMGLQCLIAYAIYWSFEELTEGRTGREKVRHILETMLIKAWWLPLAIFVTVSALLLTSSRAGFASTAVAVFLLLVMSPNRYGEKVNLVKAGSYGAVILGLAIAAFSLSGDILDSRLQVDASLDQRFIAYPYIIEAIGDRPLVGFGLGTFEEVFRFYRGPDVTIYFDRAHSDYLELAMTAGIPATVAFLLACLLPIIMLVRSLKYGAQYRSLIAVGMTVSIQLALHSLVDFSLQMPAVSYMACAIIASSIALAYRCRSAAGVGK